jgi:hypothetical protein
MEKLLSYIPWNTPHFREMNIRLMDFPEKNFSFWDHAEAERLDEYLARCSQIESVLEQFLFNNEKKHNFNENYKNVRRARDYVDFLQSAYEPIPFCMSPPRYIDWKEHTISKCDGSFDSQPRYGIPIKEAIRSGMVVRTRGSVLQYFDSARPSLEFACNDLRKCEELEKQVEEHGRVEMTKTAFLHERDQPTLLSLKLRDLDKSNKIILQ